MLPVALHGIDALVEATLKAGTLPGRANVRLAGGAEPTYRNVNRLSPLPFWSTAAWMALNDHTSVDSRSSGWGNSMLPDPVLRTEPSDNVVTAPLAPERL